MSERIDVLFVSELGLWPQDQGFRVHGPEMARALAERGLSVAMATLRPTRPDAPASLRRMLVDWPAASDNEIDAFAAGWGGPAKRLRQRVASHQAVDLREFAGVVALVRELRPSAVVALGQHGPLLLRGLRKACPGVATVWYAADEPLAFQLSCLRREGREAWPRRARSVAVYGAIHALFARGIDGVVGVSERDTRLLSACTRSRFAANVPNGVDLWRFQPMNTAPAPRSLVFWGRMDFEPNVDGVCWFAERVWPRLREREPDATWRIVGKAPTDRVRALATLPGVEVVGEVADVRPHAARAAVTILPMRCGGGIKNKLLEAAAMGLPIVASPRAVAGLALPRDPAPLRVCGSASQWADSIARLWRDADEARRLRTAARAWAVRNHSWSTAADRFLDLLDRCGVRRPSAPRQRHRPAA